MQLHQRLVPRVHPAVSALPFKCTDRQETTGKHIFASSAETILIIIHHKQSFSLHFPLFVQLFFFFSHVYVMFSLDFQEELKENYQKTKEQVDKLKVSTCLTLVVHERIAKRHLCSFVTKCFSAR